MVTGWGARAEATFGWQPKQALGLPLVELIVPPAYRAAHNAGLENYRRTGQARVLGSVLEVTALHRDGHELPVELRISPAARMDGKTVFIAFVLDITDRKQRQRELEEALADAREARVAMDGFVNMIVHELRQPLGVTLGYSDVLLTRGGLSTDAERAVQAMMTSTTSALVLVEDILLAARLGAGGLKPELAETDIPEAAASAAERARPAASIRGGSIAVETPPRAPLLARVDQKFLARILDNLVTNSLKYSVDAPHVCISVQGGAWIEVMVADQGKGIPEDMREKIFDRFVRVHDRGTVPGSGLGLYVSRQLAELQGASLTLRSSSPGKGSVFALRLPPM